MALAELVERFFAKDGPLARRLPGYAPRTAQIDMALQCAEAIGTRRGRLVVEAGTGVGKSLAYLAPVLLAQKKGLVTTATKALQDQLFQKDVPLAWACAQELLGEADAPATKDDATKDDAVLVKGRQNYLCKLRFEKFAAQPLFVFPGDVAPWPKLVQWAERTATGDRAEVPGLPEPFSTWSELDAGSEHCIGSACAHYDACFVTRNKRRAEGARLVIANHHLLCADLRLRAESRSAHGAVLASVLPDSDLYVLDEAHALPDVASDWFGVEASSAQHERLLRDVRRLAEGRSGDERAALLEWLFDVEDKAHKLWARVRLASSRERVRLDAGPETLRLAGLLTESLEVLERGIAALPEELLSGAPDGVMKAAERDRLAGRVGEARMVVDFAFVRARDDDKFVVVVEDERRATVVTATPVDVAAAIEGTVLALEAPVLMTSATLSVGGSMKAFFDRVGVRAEHEVSAHILPSPFEFARQAALYCPRDMPEPDAKSYPDKFLDEAKFLLELSKGGALFLFTSIAAMERGFEALAPTARRLGVHARKQGDMQKQALLDELRAHDGEVGMMLCATQSFWEGVDVKGRALRLVCIDRLPFKVPTDPVRKARADLTKKRGGDPFNDVAVPEAALGLKQGAGRLLRGPEDAGVVAILDGRLRSRRYGQTFLDTLPPMTRIGGRNALAEFFTRFVQPPLGLAAPGPASATPRSA